MPSEPLEASLGYPPALSRSQDEEYRMLEREGPLPRTSIAADKLHIDHAEDTHKERQVHTQKNSKPWHHHIKNWFVTRWRSIISLFGVRGRKSEHQKL
ncbi:hypothetical protein Hypma_002830 [Hypsizygus marmoreus]|uniref:Uncharacterized protein n=1 Tax=Hypsizygus marmoreus TaxID=39966 RepID=A0A369J5K9_HYPMA|nr:hypothetical protein Hypma_002830 [Hypsizygus marmoreus]